MHFDDTFTHAFPGADTYRAWRDPAPAVREPGARASAFAYSERHLQCVWFDRAWGPGELQTNEGEQVSIVSPGRWNLEEGPDFLDAVLRIGPGERLVTGDIEIHIAPSDWAAHDHAADQRYARVAAHVTWSPGSLPEGLLPPGVIQLSLRDILTAKQGFNFESIDVAAYPYATEGRDHPVCRELLLDRGPDAQIALLEAAGQERFRTKTIRLAAQCRNEDPGQVLYAETMAALGYKKNAMQFRRLAAALPVETLQAESGGEVTPAYAMLLGVAGLLPDTSPDSDDKATCAFVRELWDHWWRLRSRWEDRALDPSAWNMAGLRPQNAPIRRLAAAAALFAGDRSIAERVPSPESIKPGAWLKEAARLFACEDPIPYWRRRLGLGGRCLESDVALLGTQRIAAIISNLFVPYLAVTGKDVTPLLPLLPAEQDNALIRQAAFSLFGQDHNPAFYGTGLRQHGLLQIFHDFCLTNRNGCTRCRLADAVRAQ